MPVFGYVQFACSTPSSQTIGEQKTAATHLMILILAICTIAVRAASGQAQSQSTNGGEVFAPLVRTRRRHYVVAANGNTSPSVLDSLHTLDAASFARVVRRHEFHEESILESDESNESVGRGVAVVAPSGDILAGVDKKPLPMSFSASPDATGDASLLRAPSPPGATRNDSMPPAGTLSPRGERAVQASRRNATGLLLNAAQSAPLQDTFSKFPSSDVLSKRRGSSRHGEADPDTLLNPLVHNSPAVYASPTSEIAAAIPATVPFEPRTSDAVAATAAAPAAMQTFPSPVVRHKKMAGAWPVLGSLSEAQAPAVVRQPITTAVPPTTSALPTLYPSVASATPSAVAPASDWSAFSFVCIMSILIGISIGSFFLIWSTAGATEDRGSEERVVRQHSPPSRTRSRKHLDVSEARGTAVDTAAKNQEKIEISLKEVALFKRLPAESLTALAKVVTVKNFAAGEPMVKQGDEGNEFFMIKSGVASVQIDGQTVASLKPGDYFGENALLAAELRNATIGGNTGIAAYTITRKQFFNLGLNEKLDFPKRLAVAQGADQDVHFEPPTPKTPEEEQLIIDAVRENKSLAFMRLSETSIKEMAAVAWKVNVETGTQIITQGDMPAAYFYVVQEGSFLVSIVEESIWNSAAARASRTKDSGICRLVQAHGAHTIAKGGSFGALALLYNSPRAASVTAKEPSSVWVIARPHFKDVLLKAAEEYIGEYVQYLSSVEKIQKLPEQQKVKIAKALGEMTFKKGDVPFKQGDRGDMFYILIDGIVDIQKDGVSLFPDGDYPTARAGKAVPFGEAALESEGRCRAATVEVLSEQARCLVLDKISYEILLGKYSPQRSSSKFGQIQFKDLKRLGILGCGGFGVVELVEHAKTGETYALKIQSKSFIVEQQIENFIINEKELQLMCDSSFITKLIETYNGEESLYMLLELSLGGEVWDVYNKKGFWGQVPHAKYYVAGVVFAFEHIHSKKIIFRDLKPENLLLTHKGHVKLTDMGLAKLSVGKTYTTCGTPEYLAPEVIASRGTTPAADWWALGIVTFEFLAGYPPFNAASPMAIFKSIGEGMEIIHFPKICKGDVHGLILGLCQSEPRERLPMKLRGTDNIKNQKWYRDFDWDAMFNLTMDPPYVPRVKSKTDMANFSDKSKSMDEMPPKPSYVDPGTEWDKDYATST